MWKCPVVASPTTICNSVARARKSFDQPFQGLDHGRGGSEVYEAGVAATMSGCLGRGGKAGQLRKSLRCGSGGGGMDKWLGGTRAGAHGDRVREGVRWNMPFQGTHSFHGMHDTVGTLQGVDGSRVREVGGYGGAGMLTICPSAHLRPRAPLVSTHSSLPLGTYHHHTLQGRWQPDPQGWSGMRHPIGHLLGTRHTLQQPLQEFCGGTSTRAWSLSPERQRWSMQGPPKVFDRYPVVIWRGRYREPGASPCTLAQARGGA
jgi:hypothetical protein